MESELVSKEIKYMSLIWHIIPNEIYSTIDFFDTVVPKNTTNRRKSWKGLAETRKLPSRRRNVWLLKSKIVLRPSPSVSPPSQVRLEVPPQFAEAGQIVAVHVAADGVLNGRGRFRREFQADRTKRNLARGLQRDKI